MKILLILSMMIVTTFANANCNVFVPDRIFHHDSGYSINFDFYSLLESKGYREVDHAEDADHVLKIEGVELEGRFHKAQAGISMGTLKILETQTCLTQFCGISDYAKAFNKAYRKFSKQLPACH
jgi:hypothetical protein